MKNYKEIIKIGPKGKFCSDVPKKIVKIKINKKGNLFYELEWKLRYDNTKPKNSLLKSDIVKKNCLNLLRKFFLKRFRKKNICEDK